MVFHWCFSSLALANLALSHERFHDHERRKDERHLVTINQICPVIHKWWGSCIMRLLYYYFISIALPYFWACDHRLLSDEAAFCCYNESWSRDTRIKTRELHEKKFWCLVELSTTRFKENKLSYGEGNFTVRITYYLRIWLIFAKK